MGENYYSHRHPDSGYRTWNLTGENQSHNNLNHKHPDPGYRNWNLTGETQSHNNLTNHKHPDPGYRNWNLTGETQSHTNLQHAPWYADDFVTYARDQNEQNEQLPHFTVSKVDQSNPKTAKYDTIYGDQSAYDDRGSVTLNSPKLDYRTMVSNHPKLAPKIEFHSSRPRDWLPGTDNPDMKGRMYKIQHHSQLRITQNETGTSYGYKVPSRTQSDGASDSSKQKQVSQHGYRREYIPALDAKPKKPARLNITQCSSSQENTSQIYNSYDSNSSKSDHLSRNHELWENVYHKTDNQNQAGYVGEIYSHKTSIPSDMVSGRTLSSPQSLDDKHRSYQHHSGPGYQSADHHPKKGLTYLTEDFLQGQSDGTKFPSVDMRDNNLSANRQHNKVNLVDDVFIPQPLNKEDSFGYDLESHTKIPFTSYLNNQSAVGVQPINGLNDYSKKQQSYSDLNHQNSNYTKSGSYGIPGEDQVPARNYPDNSQSKYSKWDYLSGVSQDESFDKTEQVINGQQITHDDSSKLIEHNEIYQTVSYQKASDPRWYSETQEHELYRAHGNSYPYKGDTLDNAYKAHGDSYPYKGDTLDDAYRTNGDSYPYKGDTLDNAYRTHGDSYPYKGDTLDNAYKAHGASSPDTDLPRLEKLSLSHSLDKYSEEQPTQTETNQWHEKPSPQDKSMYTSRVQESPMDYGFPSYQSLPLQVPHATPPPSYYENSESSSSQTNQNQSNHLAESGDTQNASKNEAVKATRNPQSKEYSIEAASHLLKKLELEPESALVELVIVSQRRGKQYSIIRETIITRGLDSILGHIRLNKEVTERTGQLTPWNQQPNWLKNMANALSIICNICGTTWNERRGSQISMASAYQEKSDRLRAQVRMHPQLVKAIFDLLRVLVKQNMLHEKLVEHCCRVLHSLTYAIQEVLEPDYLNRLVAEQDKETARKGSSNWFGSMKQKKDKKTHRVSYCPRQNVSGYEYLWSTEAMELYRKLLTDSTSPPCWVAVLGILQHLSGGDWEISGLIWEAVRKSKTLPVLIELLPDTPEGLENPRQLVDDIIFSTASVLWHVTSDDRNAELIAKYGLSQIMRALMKVDSPDHCKLSNTTISLVLALLMKILAHARETSELKKYESVQHIKMLTNRTWAPNVRTYAAQVLEKLWSFKENHTCYKSWNMKKTDFFVKIPDKEKNGNMLEGDEAMLEFPLMTFSAPIQPILQYDAEEPSRLSNKDSVGTPQQLNAMGDYQTDMKDIPHFDKLDDRQTHKGYIHDRSEPPPPYKEAVSSYY